MMLPFADILRSTKWDQEARFVNAGKVKSVNLGCCFLKAGWKREGVTKGGLIILVKD